MQEYIAMWLNFADFKNRTSVRGYWMAFLFNLIISLVLGLVVGLLSRILSIFSVITWLYSVAIIVPSLAIAVRRLRDAGKPWYFIFFGLIPVVGTIILIVFLCQPTASSEGAQV